MFILNFINLWMVATLINHSQREKVNLPKFQSEGETFPQTQNQQNTLTVSFIVE